MARKNIFLIITLTVMAAVFVAFQSKQDKELPPEEAALVVEVVRERVQKFKSIRLEACRKQVLERAGELVDSILLARAKFSKFDTLYRKPLILPKPIPPSVNTPVPAVGIGPLWQENKDSVKKENQHLDLRH